MKQQIQQKVSRDKATYLFLNVQERFYGKDLKLNLEEGVRIWEAEKRYKIVIQNLEIVLRRKKTVNAPEKYRMIARQH